MIVCASFVAQSASGICVGQLKHVIEIMHQFIKYQPKLLLELIAMKFIIFKAAIISPSEKVIHSLFLPKPWAHFIIPTA